MDWRFLFALAVLVAVWLIYFFTKGRPASQTEGGSLSKDPSAVHADDGAPMPQAARNILIAYLLLFGSFVVYLLIALNSVELPEPTLLPEAASSRIAESSQDQNPSLSSDKETPLLLEIFPSAAFGSTPTISLSIYGRNFQQQSVVRFNAQRGAATYLDSNLLKAQLEPKHIVSVGAVTVDVVNPGNRISNAIAVPIMKPRARLNIFGWRPLISREVQLLLLAIFAGALGSYLHAIKSLADFIGNRTLTSSWFWWYIARPFLGMAMALVFYAVIRGGFLTGTPADARVINSFGVVAIGALVGMFADKAAQKLGEIFDTLFKSEDVRSGKLVAPVIDKLDPATVRVKEPTVVKIIGDRLGKVSRVRLNADERNPDTVSDKQVTFKLNQDDVANPAEFKISVVNPDGGVSPAATLRVTDLTIATPAILPDAKVGTQYQQPLTASGGYGSYKWSLNGHPSWLGLGQSDTLTGTPTNPGVTKVVVIVTDKATGASVTKEYDLKIT